MKLLKIGYLTKDNNNSEQSFERIVNLEHTLIELSDNNIIFIFSGISTTYEYESHLSARKNYLNLQVKLTPFLTNNEIILNIRKESFS